MFLKRPELSRKEIKILEYELKTRLSARTGSRKPKIGVQNTPEHESAISTQEYHSTLANISLWGLLMASYKHHQNLVDLLNQIQVLTTTTSQDLNAMIGSINRELTISYSDKELTEKGKHHNDPLHIIVDAKGKRIPMVLIDDGSALNVCPLKAASCSGLSIEDFVPTNQHVRAYNNCRREVLGTITLELIIGLTIKKVEF